MGLEEQVLDRGEKATLDQVSGELLPTGCDAVELDSFVNRYEVCGISWGFVRLGS